MISTRTACYKLAYKGLCGSINRALLKRTLRDATAALDELRCPFSLAYGTALGARRDGALIKHDGDVDLMITQDALIDIAVDPDERDHLINTVMKEHSFEFTGTNSAPWYYSLEHWERRDYVPVFYHYTHTRTDVGFDAYVFARHDGYYWSYVHLGRRFPILPMNKITYENREHLIFPDEWLTLVYGDWRTPKRHGEASDGTNLGMRPPYGIPPMTKSLSISPDRGEATG